MDDSVDNSGLDAYLSEEIGLLQAGLEDGLKEVMAAYGCAMMAAQLLERSVALLVTADDLEELDALPQAEVDERFHVAFTQRTLGVLKRESPIADDEQLLELVSRAWGKRNQLAHRFFLENVVAMQIPEQSDRLVSELGDAADLFAEANRRLEKLLAHAVSDRGVTLEEVDRFARVGQLLAMRDPGLLAALDVWDSEGGRQYVRRVARALGLEVDAEDES